ncbi:MAG TPA: bifunctional nuclease domain-containing protein, partial [Chloroflexota bacterium]|nr:bifunctional nuclease domain-containing protein [Chloroflexota bacterium]
GHLVQRARRGDVAAFAGLVQRHERSLTRFCHRLMPDPHVAQDLAQETLLRAYESLGRLEDPTRFGAWLFGIAANLARWWWRRHGRWPLSLEALAASYPDVPWEAAFPASRSPEQVLEAAEERRRLEGAIRTLPAALAQVLMLHYLDSLSYAEIAAALAVPVSTVKGRLFKSRVRLRRALDPQWTATQRSRQPRRGKETATMTPAAQETGGARLVPVTVESIRPTTYARAAARGAGAEQLQPGQRTGPRPRARAVVLKERSGDRYLTIVIGEPEASAMALHLQGHASPRPLSHDLMRKLLDAGGLALEQVVINRLEQDTFLSLLVLRRPEGQRVELDARPSDAINLALRSGAPIFAAEDLGCWMTSGTPAAPRLGLPGVALTPRATRVLTVAREDEPRRFGHAYVGTEHLLLALLDAGEGVAAAVLRHSGVEPDKVSQAIESTVGRGAVDWAVEPAVLPAVLTPRMHQVIELAAEEARRLQHPAVGTGHLLLGILLEGQGLAARVMRDLGLDLDTLRQAVLQALARDEPPPA